MTACNHYPLTQLTIETLPIVFLVQTLPIALLKTQSTSMEPPHHNINLFIHNTTTNLLTLLSSKTTQHRPSQISMPILFNDSPPNPPPTLSSPSESSQSNSVKTSSLGSNFPSRVRISGLNSGGKGGGGPAFVGQVFSMCDLSGTGLMAVSTHFDIPFISKRTPEWIKKIFATATNSQQNSPVFRFFMDIGDAVSYVKKLNIPSGVVGACRLDLAYEHFKEKPHLFQFVPNEKQVKEANKILKTLPQNDGQIRIDGVPVFSAQNLDIAIATTDGIKWYTPYFFDKNMLDNILEDSVDQHFQSLIHSRHMQRRRDVIDDNMGGDMPEESAESLWEPPEIQEVLDEVGHPGIPLNVISKAAEIQLHYAVDNVLLGNRWLRKATGIQPKFPYKVDTFEKRSAASLLKVATSTSCIANSETEHENTNSQLLITSSESNLKADLQTDQRQKRGSWFPFGDWFSYPSSKQRGKSDTRDCVQQELQKSPFLPKITMVGISASEAGQMSKATLKKTMEDLTRELDQTDSENSVDTTSSSYGNTFRIEDRDPLFVANVGEIYPGVAKTGSARFVRGANKPDL